MHFLQPQLTLWPPTLDEGQHCPDLFVRQNSPESRHVGLIVRASERLKPLLRHAKQDFIGVFPCVTSAVMRGRREAPVGLALAPFGLAFQIDSMAGSTVLRIETAPHGDLIQVRCVSTFHVRLVLDEESRYPSNRSTGHTDCQEESNPHHGPSLDGIRPCANLTPRRRAFSGRTGAAGRSVHLDSIGRQSRVDTQTSCPSFKDRPEGTTPIAVCLVLPCG